MPREPDFIESVARFAAYSNVDEAFYRDRPPPCPGPDLWRTEDISGRLLKMQKLELKTAAPAETSAPGPGPAPKDLGLNYVDREIVAARTEATRPTHRMQGVELVRHDLLLRSLDGGLPIVGEVKTPTDADAYYALIQLLAAASQLVTPDQATRLRNQAREATFVDVTQDRRVDLALVFVDPLRCGRTVTPTKGPQPYRPKLDAIAPRIAELILGSYGIGDYVRRIFRVDVGLVGDDLEGVVAWAFEADTATHA